MIDSFLIYCSLFIILRMEFSNCSDLFRPSTRRLESLDEWMKVFEVGGLSIKKAAAVVEVRSTTKPSHFTHFHPVKNFSSVTQLKQEPNVLNKVSSSNNTFFILF